jgi:hypothetical protein
MLNSGMLNSFMPNQSPTIVTSNRIRVQIDYNYYDVLSCVLMTKDNWRSLMQENAW